MDEKIKLTSPGFVGVLNEDVGEWYPDEARKAAAERDDGSPREEVITQPAKAKK